MRPAIEVWWEAGKAAANCVFGSMEMPDVVAAAVIEADRAEVRLAEREAVVKWLREIEKPNGRKCHHWSLATAIEAGEHRK